MVDSRFVLRCLCAWVVLGGAIAGGEESLRAEDVLLDDVEAVLLAGGYLVSPPDDPAYRVDPNDVTSPFGGVGGLAVNGAFRATGVAISRFHVLTAAHVVDLDNNGIADNLPEEVTFTLNFGGDLTHTLGVSEIHIHPDFTGFSRPALNDDLAVLTLEEPIPEGVPIYDILARPMTQGDVLTFVGYGRSGWGDIGFHPWFLENGYVKRWGRNVADVSFLDDEGRGFSEVFVFDFDGPDAATNILGDLTLGNAIETTYGFGDSGGPAFIVDGGSYKLAGINTYIARFTGQPYAAPMFGSAGGGMMVFPAGGWIAQQAGLTWEHNTLRFNVQGDPAYVRPGDEVIVDLDALNLAQRVTGLQAFLAFSSSHFSTAPGDVSVAPGAPPWNEVIYSVFSADGDLDMAVGVDLQSGELGTQEDATTAVISLVATGEGTTRLVFRPDPAPDPGLTRTTMFADTWGLTVLPRKVDSQAIVVDGTPPTITLAATQEQGGVGVDVLACAHLTHQGEVWVAVTAADLLAGLEGPPVVTVSKGDLTLPVTYSGEDPAGQFNCVVNIDEDTETGEWMIHGMARDRAGNNAEVAGVLCFDRQMAGTVRLATYSSVDYGFVRDVVFVASGEGGGVLKSWTISVDFTNHEEVASGSYVLADVPAGIAALSAKTAWHLRRRQEGALSGEGQGTIDFVLLGGDLNGSNSVNVLDYSLLKTNWGISGIGDINGDGVANILDYSALKSAWFAVGEKE